MTKRVVDSTPHGAVKAIATSLAQVVANTATPLAARQDRQQWNPNPHAQTWTRYIESRLRQFGTR